MHSEERHHPLRMWRKRCLFIASCTGMLLTQGTAAKNRPQPEDLAKFLHRVRDAVNIRAAGSPPFHLRAQVRADFLEGGKRYSEGVLDLSWFSPREWREEIRFDGFDQVRILNQGRTWIARNVPYQPLRVYQLKQLMNVASVWSLKPNEFVDGVKERHEKGEATLCVKVKKLQENEREVCADAQLLRPTRVTLNDSDLSSTEYGDYAPWGNKVFPHLMHAYEGKNVVVEARVVELGAISESKVQVLSPPAGALTWKSCDNPDLPKAIQKSEPSYPKGAVQERREGRVLVYAVVATDGSLQYLHVVRSAGGDLDAATLAAMSRWRFRPAACGGDSVPSETLIEVEFTLAP